MSVDPLLGHITDKALFPLLKLLTIGHQLLPQATQRHSYSTRDEASGMLMWVVRPWAWISTEVPPERVGSWIISFPMILISDKNNQILVEHFCLYCRLYMTLHNKRNWNTLIVSYSYPIFCVRWLNYWYLRRSCSSLLCFCSCLAN